MSDYDARYLFSVPSTDPELDELNESLPGGYHAWRGVTGSLYVRRERSSPAWVRSRETAAEIRSAVADHEAGKDTTQ